VYEEVKVYRVYRNEGETMRINKLILSKSGLPISKFILILVTLEVYYTEKTFIEGVVKL